MLRHSYGLAKATAPDDDDDSGHRSSKAHMFLMKRRWKETDTRTTNCVKKRSDKRRRKKHYQRKKKNLAADKQTSFLLPNSHSPREFAVGDAVEHLGNVKGTDRSSSQQQPAGYILTFSLQHQEETCKSHDEERKGHENCV